MARLLALWAALWLGLATAASAEMAVPEDGLAAERGCLAVIGGYSDWLERVEIMGLGGAESGFYGNPTRELARIENARYALLLQVAKSAGVEDITEFSMLRDASVDARLATQSASEFRALGEEFRTALKPCLGELMAKR